VCTEIDRETMSEIPIEEEPGKTEVRILCLFGFSSLEGANSFPPGSRSFCFSARGRHFVTW
jgi:hypothetical protein